MHSKQVVLTALAVLAFAYGVAAAYFFPGQLSAPTDPWFTLACAVLVFVWFRLDADHRQYRRSFWLNVSVVGFALLALPYYFFRSRGAKNGFVTTGLFVLALVAFLALLGGGFFVGEVVAAVVRQS